MPNPSLFHPWNHIDPSILQPSPTPPHPTPRRVRWLMFGQLQLSSGRFVGDSPLPESTLQSSFTGALFWGWGCPAPHLVYAIPKRLSYLLSNMLKLYPPTFWCPQVHLRVVGAGTNQLANLAHFPLWWSKHCLCWDSLLCAMGRAAVTLVAERSCLRCRSSTGLLSRGGHHGTARHLIGDHCIKTLYLMICKAELYTCETSAWLSLYVHLVILKSVASCFLDLGYSPLFLARLFGIN